MKASTLFASLSLSAGVLALAVRQVPIDINGNPIPPCWAKLNCAFDVIENMNMSDRLALIDYIQNSRLGNLRSPTEFQAFAGILTYCNGTNLGAPGSWFSYVNAAIVEAIMRGTAIASGVPLNRNGNPGSQAMAGFLTGMGNGSLSDYDAHLKAASAAEQTANEYGVGLANATGAPTSEEAILYAYTQMHRDMQAERTFVLKELDSFMLSSAAEELIDWMTVTTEDIPTTVGAEVATTFSNFTAGNVLNISADLNYWENVFEVYELAYIKWNP